MILSCLAVAHCRRGPENRVEGVRSMVIEMGAKKFKFPELLVIDFGTEGKSFMS